MTHKPPIAEPAAEPVPLDFVYDAEPEQWTPEQLAAAVAQQRAERDKRAVKKAKKAKKAE